jgi:hypothetical protein
MWGRPTPRVGRTWPATRPDAFRGVVVAKALDNFHMCIWREPTSTSINRPLLQPPQHTHTHFISLIPRRLSLSLVLCWRKNQHTGIRGQVFAKLRKVNQACQSIWPEIDKGENKVKFESVSARIPNISHTGVWASFADIVDDKRILNASV